MNSRVGPLFCLLYVNEFKGQYIWIIRLSSMIVGTRKRAIEKNSQTSIYTKVLLQSTFRYHSWSWYGVVLGKWKFLKKWMTCLYLLFGSRFFKSSMCYYHKKCRFQYYIGLLNKPLNNYSLQKKPELNQTKKQNIHSFLYRVFGLKTR